jgi:hypothetical protein
MQAIRYTGEDIPIDVVLYDESGAVINPADLQAIDVYLVASDGETVEKYAHPEKQDTQPLHLYGEGFIMYIESEKSNDLAGRKLHLQVNIRELAPELTGGSQNTIALSDHLIIKHASVGQESITE